MAELLWLRKAYSDGWHNAFTDLALWRGRYYICFRNSVHHHGCDGKIVLIESEDLETWRRVAVPLNTHGDDRDPHMVSTPDRLYLYTGTWMIRKGERVNVGFRPARDCWTFCSYTEDGKSWSEPVCVSEANEWLWSPTRIGDMFYCVSYPNCRVEEQDRSTTQLLKSADGLDWRHVSTILDHDGPNETALRMKPDGRLQAMIRAERVEAGSYIAESPPPFTGWEIFPIRTTIESPEYLETGGEVYVAGRGVEPNPEDPSHPIQTTALWRMSGRDAQLLLTLPSAGDNAYPGLLAREDGTILMSYYSQHDVPEGRRYWQGLRPADIFLACIRP